MIFMKLVITLKSQANLSITLVSPLVTLNSNEFGLPGNARMELGTGSYHILVRHCGSDH